LADRSARRPGGVRQAVRSLLRQHRVGRRRAPDLGVCARRHSRDVFRRIEPARSGDPGQAIQFACPLKWISVRLQLRSGNDCRPIAPQCSRCWRAGRSPRPSRRDNGVGGLLAARRRVALADLPPVNSRPVKTDLQQQGPSRSAHWRIQCTTTTERPGRDHLTRPPTRHA